MADALERIHALSADVIRLVRSGAYAQAEPKAHEAVVIARTHFAEHPVLAEALHNQAAVFVHLSRFAESEAGFREALQIDRSSLGRFHPDYARDLSNLGALLQRVGKLQEAKEVLQEALEVRGRTLGEQHPAFATTLNNLARALEGLGDVRAAEPLLRRALDIARVARGDNDPDTALCRISLGEICRALGNMREARQLLERALIDLQDAYGDSHPQVGDCSRLLATILREAGEYAAAEHAIRRALEIRAETVGENHPGHASCRSELGAIYEARGDFAAAEKYYRESLDTMERVMGPTHENVAAGKQNLGVLYARIGVYDRAERLLTEALQIHEQNLGVDHPGLLSTLNNLAGVHDLCGRSEGAIALYERALGIARRSFGETHDQVALLLNNLGAAYNRRGEFGKAGPFFARARDLSLLIFGEQHERYAYSLNNVASVYDALGDWPTAEALYREASDIMLKRLGEFSLEAARMLNNVAGICAAQERTEEALVLFRRAAGTIDRSIGQVFSIASDRERSAHLAAIRDDYYALLSFVCSALPQSEEAVTFAFECVLRRKALTAEALAVQRETVLGGRYPHLTTRLAELADARRAVVDRVLARGERDSPQDPELLTDLEERRDRLEAELAREIPELCLDMTLRAAGRAAVAQALPADSALLEFARFDFHDPAAVETRGERRWKGARYVCFVLRGGSGALDLINLGDAQMIDAAVIRFRNAMVAGMDSGAERDIVIERATPFGEHLEASAVLRAACFDPLQKAIGAARQLFVAADGDLCLVPFAALAMDAERFVGDAVLVRYLVVGRDLLAATGSERVPSPALVMADPDFDLGTDSPADADRTIRARKLADFDVHFTRLPGTRIEGELVSGMLGVRAAFGAGATKSAVRSVRWPRILHLATHGFFLPTAPTPHTGAAAGNRAGIANPMIRSGMAFAGANAPSGSATRLIADDGILTAEEVTSLDLAGTELVVLSACNTGVGEVRTAEGVFGLRRAFGLAGARNLVMSLWKIPDLASAILMQRFYEGMVGDAMAPSAALHRAQVYLRTATVQELAPCWLTPEMAARAGAHDARARIEIESLAAKRPDDRPFAHPFFWAAFICQEHGT